MPKLARDSLLSILPHIAPRLASVALFVLIGRRAGAGPAGVFALAISFSLIVTTIMRGLDELVVREVARQPSAAARYLLNFVIVRLALSVGLYALVVAAVRGLFRYPAATANPVLLLALSVVPDGVAYVAQAVLNGQRHYGGPAVVLSLTSALKVASGAMALWLGYALDVVMVSWLICSGLGALALFSVALWRAGGMTRQDWRDWSPLKANLQPALSLVAITLLLAFESQTDTLLLSKVRSETEVGWYGAATTVAFGLLTLSQAYRFTAYPVMARYAQSAPQKLEQFYRDSMRLIVMFALPMSTGLVIIAPQLVGVLYGGDFARSVLPLQILSLALLFMFANEPNSRMMLVRDRQREALWLLIMATLLNVALNVLLTPIFGEVGAALARLGSTLGLFGGYFYYVSTRLNEVDILRLSHAPFMATFIMAGVLWLVRGIPLAALIMIGVLTYVAAVAWLDRATFRQAWGAWQLARSRNTSK